MMMILVLYIVLVCTSIESTESIRVFGMNDDDTRILHFESTESIMMTCMTSESTSLHYYHFYSASTKSTRILKRIDAVDEG